MQIEHFKKAKEIQYKIEKLRELENKIRPGLDVVIKGKYQKGDYPELVDKCILIFSKYFTEEIKKLELEFADL